MATVLLPRASYHGPNDCPPPLAAAVMAAVIAPLRTLSLPLGVSAGLVAGGLVLVLAGAFRHPDFEVLRQAMSLHRLRARWSRLRGPVSS